MQINPQQIAVLADRLERMTDELKGVRTSVDDMRFQFAEFKATPAEVAALKLVVAEQSKEISRNSFVIKLGGTVLMLCVGLIGWGWKEAKGLYSADNAADRRLLMIEYKLNIPPPAAEGDKDK
ncbi:putative holin [Xanthomonas phage Langgrundblatt2]|jgi:hypothetical protein|uniref:Holin n=2 Tax=Shirevirus TaxID=3153128 RepID=A0A9E7E313_9CAUD|nr:putative holin [Xanthomonas phage Langgrundblatt1]YP_010742904.1 putative holin [Xanthomonas phage Langgrundblatt2]URA06786.1 putative holin [Xanthomonas phage Langgrundblatt1]URA06855.1 putative holin [Xanthomonas phage Langgrundblatt2]